MLELNSVHRGDCLELITKIESGSIDAIITDPPYGTIKGLGLGTQYGTLKTDWDIPIDHERILQECDRVLRPKGVLILFCQDPYTGKLLTKTHRNLAFSHRLTWLKDHFGNALLVKQVPAHFTEDICVFYKKYDTFFQHPLRKYAARVLEFTGKKLAEISEDLGHKGAVHFLGSGAIQFALCTEKTYSELIRKYGINQMDGFLSYQEMRQVNRQFPRCFNLPDGKRYKSNVLEYRKDYTGLHPTQKPVLLMEDLVKTYSGEGALVLDFCAGSGTTGVACLRQNRNFIMFEKDPQYYEVICRRLEAEKEMKEEALSS